MLRAVYILEVVVAGLAEGGPVDDPAFAGGAGAERGGDGEWTRDVLVGAGPEVGGHWGGGDWERSRGGCEPSGSTRGRGPEPLRARQRVFLKTRRRRVSALSPHFSLLARRPRPSCRLLHDDPDVRHVLPCRHPLPLRPVSPVLLLGRPPVQGGRPWRRWRNWPALVPPPQAQPPRHRAFPLRYSWCPWCCCRCLPRRHQERGTHLPLAACATCNLISSQSRSTVTPLTSLTKPSRALTSLSFPLAFLVRYACFPMPAKVVIADSGLPSV